MYVPADLTERSNQSKEYRSRGGKIAFPFILNSHSLLFINQINNTTIIVSFPTVIPKWIPTITYFTPHYIYHICILVGHICALILCIQTLTLYKLFTYLLTYLLYLYPTAVRTKSFPDRNERTIPVRLDTNEVRWTGRRECVRWANHITWWRWQRRRRRASWAVGSVLRWTDQRLRKHASPSALARVCILSFRVVSRGYAELTLMIIFTNTCLVM